MIYKIAVCDDEEIICKSIYSILKNIANSKRIKIEADCFTTGEELCEEMNKTNYDLLFLDIELPKMNGVAVGKYIRDNLKNETLQIAYISSKQEYAMELFEMHPINFLVKPLYEEKIERIINKFLLINKVDTGIFTFKSGHDFIKIALSDILYFYSSGRKVNIVTNKSTYDFYSSLETIYGDLKNSNFLYVHKSFMVNYRYISKFSYEKIRMSDDTEIPISQSRRKVIRQQFMKIKMEETQ